MQEQHDMGLGPSGEEPAKAKAGELADEQLAGVSGGRWYTTEYKVGDTCTRHCAACHKSATFTCVEPSVKIDTFLFFDELCSTWKCENCGQQYLWTNVAGWRRI